MSQDPLHLLCVEPRFPGRLGAVADWLVRRRGYRCQFFCHQVDPREHWPEAVGNGLDVVVFNVGGVARESAVPWTRGLERGLCYAYGAWEVIDARRPRPVDLVLGRSAGLGSSLFAPVALPHVPIVSLLDYYYHPHAHDLAGESEIEMPIEYSLWRRAANAMDLLDLENGATPWTPTPWQRSLYPSEYHDEITVLYDGVDTRRFERKIGDPRTIAGRVIPPETRVVSFVARSPDWLRGFDRFVGLANRLLRERTDVLCVVAGGGTVERMLDVRSFGRDFVAETLAAQPPPDPSRFWNLGRVAPGVIAELLAATDLHVVASRTYAVARSTVEAMSAGAVILAYDSAPLREFVSHERNGLLAPVDDPDAAWRLAQAVLDDAGAYQSLGIAAATGARDRWAQDVTLPKLATLFDRLASG